MANTFDVKPDTVLELDDNDWKFIEQAQVQEIRPASAIRARYTTLLADQTPNGGNVRFPQAGRKPEKVVRIQHTYIRELVEKLRRLGLHETARRGLKEFNRQDASNFLKDRRLRLDYQTRRIPETRKPINWADYGGDIDQAMDQLLRDRLPLSDAVRDYWSRNKGQIKKDVRTGMDWSFGPGAPYEGADKDEIFRRVLAYVLLSGYNPDKTNLEGIVLQRQRWVHVHARKQCTMEMRKRYGSRWKDECHGRNGA